MLRAVDASRAVVTQEIASYREIEVTPVATVRNNTIWNVSFLWNATGNTWSGTVSNIYLKDYTCKDTLMSILLFVV